MVNVPTILLGNDPFMLLKFIKFVHCLCIICACTKCNIFFSDVKGFQNHELNFKASTDDLNKSIEELHTEIDIKEEYIDDGIDVQPSNEIHSKQINGEVHLVKMEESSQFVDHGETIKEEIKEEDD